MYLEVPRAFSEELRATEVRGRGAFKPHVASGLRGAGGVALLEEMGAALKVYRWC